jgi:hypothetical protein
MKLVRPTAIVVLFAMVAVLIGANAGAQQPQATPTSVSTPSRFPENAPPGWDQKKWNHITKACYQIAEKARSHKPLSPSEFEESGICTSLSAEFLTPNSPPPD